MTIIGTVAGLATVYFVIAQGNLIDIFLNPLAATLVFGGTISATLIAYPWETLKEAIPSIRHLYIKPRTGEADRRELIDLFASLAEKARKMNIESLQAELPGIKNRFLVQGLQMVIDGIEQNIVRDNLDKEILHARQKNQKISGVFNTMATLAPIFGLLGTLIGIVGILRNLADPTTMGKAMAVGITATFYGIFAANFIFVPTATKLGEHGDNEVVTKELITDGILSLQQGDLPLIMRKKLETYITTKASEKENS